MSEGNGLAGRDALFAPAKRRYIEEDVVGLGRCRFQSWTERERSMWEQRPYNKRGELILARQREQRAALIAYSWVDADGNRQLSDKDISSAAIENVDSRVIARMAQVALEHVGLSESDVDGEDAVKNSEPTRDD